MDSSWILVVSSRLRVSRNYSSSCCLLSSTLSFSRKPCLINIVIYLCKNNVLVFFLVITLPERKRRSLKSTQQRGTTVVRVKNNSDRVQSRLFGSIKSMDPESRIRIPHQTYGNSTGTIRYLVVFENLNLYKKRKFDSPK